MFALPDLLEETRQKLKQAYGNDASVSTLSMVWGHTCIFIEEQMVKGKGVAFPGLGNFTFFHKKKELGNRGTRITKYPVFVPADAFCQTYDLRKENVNLFVSVPSVTLNNSWIASQSSTARDLVIDFHKEAVRCIGAAVRANKNISLDIDNIGTLTCASDTLKLQFNSDFIAQVRVSSNPNKSDNFDDTKSGTSEIIDLETVKSMPQKLRVNNLVLSPIPSRASTPYQDPKEDSLPQVGASERPQAPVRKQRTGDMTPLRPLSSQGFQRAARTSQGERGGKGNAEEDGEGEGDVEKCEDCLMSEINQRAARLRRMQERAAEDVAIRAQKALIQAIDEKELKALSAIKSRREDADTHNRALVSYQQEVAAKEKKADFYGDVLYSRKPDTPARVKKAKYKTLLEEQMEERRKIAKQHQSEAKKGFEVFLESQREADRRARQQKADERVRQKEYSDFLMQQISSKPRPEPLEPVTSPLFERSLPSVSATSPVLTRASLDTFERHRPSTAARDARRKSFDQGAYEQAKEILQIKKQQEEEEKARLAREQEKIRLAFLEDREKLKDEELQKKLQTRDLLRNAWNNQLDQKRASSLGEARERDSPMLNTLDLTRPESAEPKKCCAECGRGIKEVHNHRRTSGDYRLTSNEVAIRRARTIPGPSP